MESDKMDTDISEKGDKANTLLRHEDKVVPPDGGFGWIAVVAAHFALLLSMGSMGSFGPFIVRLKNYFDEGAVVIGGISGVAMFVTLATGSIASGLSTRFGFRPVVITGGVISTLGLALSAFASQAQLLYVTYSVITAIGYSLVTTPVMIFPAVYFKKHYALANGITSAGLAVAWITIPSLSQFLIEVYGWRGAMLILAAITCNICVCGVLLKSPERQHSVDDDVSLIMNGQTAGYQSIGGTREFQSERTIALKDVSDYSHVEEQEESNLKKCLNIFDVSLFSNPLFLLIFIVHLFSAIAFFPSLLFLVARAVSYGIPQPLPATLLTVWGSTSLLGRLTHGVIIDRNIISAIQGLVGGLLVCGLVNIFSCFKTNYLGLALMYGVFGLFNGVYHPLTTVIIRDYIGSQKFPQGQGLCNISRGIGAFLGAPIVGWIYDTSGSYNVCYLFSGGMFILSSLLLATTPLLRKCQAK